MAVLSCSQTRELETGESDAQGRWTYEIGYRVITDETTDNIPTVVTGAWSAGPSPLPRRGTWYPGNVSARLERYRVTRARDATEWNVSAIFKAPEDEEDDQDNTHPLARPPRYRIEEEHFTEAVDKDRFGNALANSAGQPFDEGIEIERSRVVLVAEKNFGSLNAILGLNRRFVGKVNSGAYRGFGSRTWLCRGITSSPQQAEVVGKAVVRYYVATYRLALETDKWNTEVLDTGFVNAAGKVLTQPTAREANEEVPAPREVLLDGAGGELAVGAKVQFVAKGGGFQIYKQTSFSQLGV